MGLGEAVWKSDDPFSFHRLVTHDGAEKESAELMMQAHVVVFFLRLLKATGYRQDGQEFGEEERRAALLLHHFMRVAFYNSHETTEVEKTGPGWSDNSLQKIGRATNPSLALINHGCDPNYDRVSWGRITLGFACKPIAAGEEIVDTYCQPFVAVDKEERRQRLAKYNFCCACNACKHNWPRMGGLEGRMEGLPEDAYNVPKSALAEAMGRVAQAEAKAEKVMDGRAEEAVVGAIEMLEALHWLLKRPHQAITCWESQLCQLLLHLHSARVERHTSCHTTLCLPPNTL